MASADSERRNKRKDKKRNKKKFPYKRGGRNRLSEKVKSQEGLFFSLRREKFMKVVNW